MVADRKGNRNLKKKLKCLKTKHYVALLIITLSSKMIDLIICYPFIVTKCTLYLTYFVNYVSHTIFEDVKMFPIGICYFEWRVRIVISIPVVI